MRVALPGLRQTQKACLGESRRSRTACRPGIKWGKTGRQTDVPARNPRGASAGLRGLDEDFVGPGEAEFKAGALLDRLVAGLQVADLGLEAAVALL